MKRLSVALLTLVASMASAQTYDEAGLKAFRAEREKVLLADNGWFTACISSIRARTSSARIR